jgi:hypothetical protein
MAPSALRPIDLKYTFFAIIPEFYQQAYICPVVNEIHVGLKGRKEISLNLFN